ncbi:hypothetical protein [Pseudobacillus wudalianchiensis]|uniref:hypothetical protein n=1 Tax=Pseudobacillus wudalianchiensis TaxID=1743143 RepID=UPI001147384D|nr:hypothetical protein [Bacillus wudalianchiensis]
MTPAENSKPPYALAPAARQEKRKQLPRLGRHKTDRRSGALCHTGVTAYDRESSRCNWTIEMRSRLPCPDKHKTKWRSGVLQPHSQIGL